MKGPPYVLFSSLANLIRYRGLVQSLVARELKARYRGSVLGFVWTIPIPGSLEEQVPWFNWTLLAIAVATAFYVQLSPALSAGSSSMARRECSVAAGTRSDRPQHAGSQHPRSMW